MIIRNKKIKKVKNPPPIVVEGVILPGVGGFDSRYHDNLGSINVQKPGGGSTTEDKKPPHIYLPPPYIYSSGSTSSTSSNYYGYTAPPATGWTTPAELGGDATPDTVLQFKFDAPQWFNTLSFELGNDPLNWSVWFFDINRNILVQMTDVDGDPIGGTLSGASQQGSNSEDDFNLLHDGTRVTPGNFVKFAFNLPQLKTNLIEIHLDRRIPEELLPVHVRTEIRLAYPLAVRNVKISTEITKRNQLPPLHSEDIRITNPLGHVERLTLKEWEASRALDGSATTYWKSTPQPTSTAVVPFYLDLRDASGEAQLIDRIELDPVFTGPHMNIYYSNDDTVPGGFSTSFKNQVLTVRGPTGLVMSGSYYLSYNGMMTDAIIKNATAATIQSRLEALPNIGAGNISVQEVTDGVFTIDFPQAMNLIITDQGTLENGTATITTFNFDLKEWTPLQRDYTLMKGIYHLPPVKAKYLKLEFTNLSCQPYQTWDEGIKRTVKEYPQWVEQWYATTIAQAAGIPYQPAIIQEHFTDRVQVGSVTTTTRRRLTFRPSVIFQPSDWFTKARHKFVTSHSSSAIYDDVQSIKSSLDTDVEFLTNLQNQVVRKKFFKTVRHTYDEREVTVTNKEAYFVGLREVNVYRVDYAKGEDTAEYIETFADDTIIASNTLVKQDDGHLFAGQGGDFFETVTLNSFSTFKALQLAVQASNWESQMSDRQMSLANPSNSTSELDAYLHLQNPDNVTLVSGTGASGDPYVLNPAQTTVDWDISTTRFSGEGGGNVILLTPTGTNVYGVKTVSGIFKGDSTYDAWDTAAAWDEPLPESWDDLVPDGYDSIGAMDDAGNYDDVNSIITDRARTSVVARIFLPETNMGTYELRLYSNNTLVARKEFTPPAQRWYEAELLYISSISDDDLQAEIVQTDTTVNEPFALDFLSIFQNPVRWEVSNDDGTTWHLVRSSINNPNGFITFSEADKRLKVRATALRRGAVISGFNLVPWYEESPVVQRIPIDYVSPWGSSDREDMRATHHKPMFRLWHRLFPQQYSLDQLGDVPLSGSGFVP